MTGEFCIDLLEELPLLRQVAQHGEIAWSKLRVVVRVASTDTEELWLTLCRKLNSEQVRRLVKITPVGAIPGEVRTDRIPHSTEYRCTLPPEVVTEVLL